MDFNRVCSSGFLCLCDPQTNQLPAHFTQMAIRNSQMWRNGTFLVCQFVASACKVKGDLMQILMFFNLMHDGIWHSGKESIKYIKWKRVVIVFHLICLCTSFYIFIYIYLLPTNLTNWWKKQVHAGIRSASRHWWFCMLGDAGTCWRGWWRRGLWGRGAVKCFFTCV